jgi:UDP-N-acetylmuramate--alanine ligase
VPIDNPERVTAREQGIRELSYFEALGEATREGTSIVVSGTHGKTTTTAMLAKILIDTGRQPTVIAGSILAEQGSNFIAGRPDLFIIEGCEYRRHFLHLHPSILVVTNIELDHTDYYTDLEDMQSAFFEVTRRVPEHGTIITNTDAPTIKPILADSSVRVVPYQTVTVPPLRIPGTFNEENARSAKATAYAYDPELHEADIDKALAGFKGTWRRFEYKGVTAGGAMVYDDYAHHPTAVRGTLTAMRKQFPDLRIIVAFHPHLYSRTRDFMDDFAESLALADEVLLAPIYAAREAPITGVTSDVLAEKITTLGTPARAFASLNDIQKVLGTTPYYLSPTTLLITMGAGDIYRVADALVAQN